MSDATRPPARWSTLALWHPDGVAPRNVVLGRGCPPKLRGEVHPLDREARENERADLVIVCPERDECRHPRWLDDAFAAAAARLAEDGVMYVVLPARARWGAAGRLRAHGLAVVDAVAHLPDVATSRYLVPLAASPLRYALARLMPSYPRTRRLARAALSIPGAADVVRAVAPAVALVARRPAARPLFEWLLRLGSPAGEAHAAAPVVAVTSWRASGGPTVLHLLEPGREQAALVVKVPAAARDVSRIADEASALCRLAPAARAAGARLPDARLDRLADGRQVLVQSAVAGRPLAAVIAEHPAAATTMLDAVAAWLERWNRATLRAEALDPAVLEREVLAPAALLAPHVVGGEEYRHWLVGRCAKVAGTRVPFTARHNDLTMRNVLVDGDGPLGIVDWETADEMGLPNTDLAYAIVDAIAAAAGYASRSAAFTASFTPAGAHVTLARDLLGRAGRALELSPALAEVAFHGCWLRHAANEMHASETGTRGPFLALVEELAQQRELLSTGIPA